jgi:hypothetical protein
MPKQAVKDKNPNPADLKSDTGVAETIHGYQQF